MNPSDPQSADVRAFMLHVAEEFRRLDPSSRPKAVLEPADAADSFQYDLVRAKFRKRGRDDVNATGIIVTVEDDASVPEDVTQAELARIIATRLRPVGVEMSRGSISRVRYASVTLDDLLRAEA